MPEHDVRWVRVGAAYVNDGRKEKILYTHVNIIFPSYSDAISIVHSQLHAFNANLKSASPILPSTPHINRYHLNSPAHTPDRPYSA